MSERYEHEIVDSAGARQPFSLTVEDKGAGGEMVWPPETSRLEAVRRITEARITALIVWPTMRIRCWIEASPSGSGTDLVITFALTPYRYRIEDGGAFLGFLAGLAIPGTGVVDAPMREQPAPPGGRMGNEGEDDSPSDRGDCGKQVYVVDRSTNQDYAYYFLVNEADRFAGVTIRNSWMYEGKERWETKRHDLYPGEEREVFSFPRAQDPKCRITHCRLGLNERGARGD